MTQTKQVIETMRRLGGFATLGKLNRELDFSRWLTKTPEASVRRIVQDSPAFFRIKPGLWALEECREAALARLGLETVSGSVEPADFTHAYYQGLLVEIGKMQSKLAYIPAQDKSKLYLGKPLGDIANTTDLPPFTYPAITQRAKTVDVIWFNCRQMPCSFFEVEHSTDIQNSLDKFFDLQDFYAKFYIVADEHKGKRFRDIIARSIYRPISVRVEFRSYESVARLHTRTYALSEERAL
jgi:hypothetical protein